MSKFLERCSKIDCLKTEIKPLHLTLFDLHIPYLNEAVECFHKELPISCIIVSSTLVEICLCWEHWRRKPEEQRRNIPNDEFKRDTLGPLFGEFLDSDISLDKLLDFDEKEELGKMENEKKLSYIKRVRYILTRNKFAHGDLVHNITLGTLISGHEKDWLDYGIDNSEEWVNASLETVAYIQLLKTLRFIKAFTDFLIETEKTKRK
jgi:hypothetical protein